MEDLLRKDIDDAAIGGHLVYPVLIHLGTSAGECNVFCTLPGHPLAQREAEAPRQTYEPVRFVLGKLEELSGRLDLHRKLGVIQGDQ